MVRTEEPQLDSHGSLIYEWMTLITSLHTWKGMGLLQMRLQGIGGWRHLLNGAIRLACVESKMVSTLLTCTLTKIKTSMGVMSPHSLKHTFNRRGPLCGVMKGPASPFCQINVAPLRGPLVNYILADAWMGQPPAPNDPSDVRY